MAPKRKSRSRGRSGSLAAAVPTKNPLMFQRKTTSHELVWTDTFKLTAAKYYRLNGVDVPVQDRDESFYIQMEHAHVYRTIDSDGKSDSFTTPMGGHSHPIEILRDGKGKPVIKDGKPVLKIGPPMQQVRRKVGNKMKPVWEKISLYHKHNEATGTVDVIYDEHVHEFEYLKSTQVKMREVSAKAIAVMDGLDSRISATMPEGAKG